MLVMFFCGVRVGHVFWWGSCWSCFLVGFVLVMFFGGVRVSHVFLVGSVLVMFFGGVRVGQVFSFMCCPIMCLYVLSSML